LILSTLHASYANGQQPTSTSALHSNFSTVVVTAASVCLDLRLPPGALKLSNHHHLPSLAERISAFLEERLDWEAQQQQQQVRLNSICLEPGYKPQELPVSCRDMACARGAAQLQGC
jgi:hypothetical protein